MPNMMVSARVLNEDEKLSLLKLHQDIDLSNKYKKRSLLGLDKNSPRCPRQLATLHPRVYCDNLVPRVLGLFGQREGPGER